MKTTRIDVRGLYSALDAARRTEDKSWRTLAKDTGVGPSLFSRMANGYKPDADSFAKLVDYLRVDASQFFTDRDEDADREEPELVVQLAPLLRARKDLNDADVAYIEEVISATVRRARAAANG
ncbi:helix-turn-helix domain-containing protein [Leifsonia shinshuensis]|uniref:Helix-turn-helix transcriptional regulator n=1 Tax=Leifsonia shinshuensis TaxID=150026 RepID=A0A7G6YA66_9MICO|nr:helix-turn-helix transcriptional regulator [Leifsonia shinshuensis]QNE35381.1 helix-turn-helix transcriptional regulator [Leifsonia shinshuensis]